MWSLIVKIFLCYWIVTVIVIFVVDSAPHTQLSRHEAYGALADVFRLQGQNVLKAYEAGGCAAAKPLLTDSTNRIYLALPDGTTLCGGDPGVDFRPLIAKARNLKVPIAINLGSFQVLALDGMAPSGKRYTLLFHRKLPRFFGFWPGRGTIVVSGIVTFFLAFLVAIPIRRLSSAARGIANGDLDARVPQPDFLRVGFLAMLFRPFQSDIIQALIVDFNHMADRLQSLVDAQRVFLRDVSHELRSPLARLSVALALARQSGDSSLKLQLDRIQDEAARVNQLIEQLLSLAYTESILGRELADTVSLSRLVASMMPDIEYEAKGNKCRVVANTNHDCLVLGDQLLLQRALENVVRNAIRHTPEDGMIEIAVERLERNGVWRAILRVADTGPGVPTKELESILLPFYRVEGSGGRSSDGFGVGLAIVDRAVKLHAGQIVAWNKPTGGLIVEMSFPLARASS